MTFTISCWIKQTVLLDYQPFNSDSQDLHIEAHIRSMSVSLVFKGGVSSDICLLLLEDPQFVTTFYLKDVVWQSLDKSMYKLWSCGFSSACSQFLCIHTCY